MSTKTADSRQRYYKNKDKDVTVSNIFILSVWAVWRGYLNVSVGMHRAACDPAIPFITLAALNISTVFEISAVGNDSVYSNRGNLVQEFRAFPSPKRTTINLMF